MVAPPDPSVAPSDDEALADLKRRSRELEAKREERRATATAARDRKVLEETTGILPAIEDEHGLLDRDIAAIFSPKDGRMVVVKTPKAVAYQRFQERMLSNKPLTTQNLVELVYPCLVHPDVSTFESINDAAPGMLAIAADACAKLAGAAKEDSAGK